MTQRWTAYKMNVNDIVNGNYGEEGLDFGSLKVQRVRIMGSVVQKFVADDKKYGFFILDDGTETIRVRCFQDSINLIEDTEMGDLVDVFGRLREYQGELYVIPEIVVKVDDPNFYFLRKLELKKQMKRLNVKPAEKKEIKKEDPAPPVEEEVIEEVLETPKEQTLLPKGEEPTPRKKVVDCIAGFDKGEGVEITTLKTSCGLDSDIVEKVLTDLMNEGEIFEPRAGKVKILG